MELNYYLPSDLTKATTTELTRALEDRMNRMLKERVASWGDNNESKITKEIREIQKELEDRTRGAQS